MTVASYWIDRLGLLPHPEGGFYAEWYRSADSLAPGILGGRYRGPRSAATAIYFLLTADSFSSLHRLRSDELWNYHAGAPLTVHVIDPDGTARMLRIGLDLDAGQRPQAVVPAGCWFGATVDEPGGYSLVGCTVAPGFEFDDFELADREALTRTFPGLADLIAGLTR